MSDEPKAGAAASTPEAGAAAPGPKVVKAENLDPKKKYIARVADRVVTVAKKPKMTAAQTMRDEIVVILDGKELRLPEIPANITFIEQEKESKKS